MKKIILAFIAIFMFVFLVVSCGGDTTQKQTSKIIFDSNGGSAVSTITAEVGTKVVAPSDPVKDGYVFLGWYLDGELYEFNVIPDSNILLIAQWEKIEDPVKEYTITFDVAGGDALAQTSIKGEAGVTIVLPIPTREGYNFLGWYNGTDIFEENVMPEANITLVAKWEEQEVIVPPTIEEYTITLDVNGGNTLAQTSITAEAGAPIVIPTPTREVYNFLGWYNGEVKFEQTTMPKENITLVAKWEEIEIPVVQDTVLPIINIEGGLETKLNWGKEFNPLKGVTANDNVDGDVTNKIVVEGEVNNKKYGTYKLTYTVSDEAGNTRTIERVVEVIWDYEVMFIGHQGSYYGVPNTEEAFLYAAEVLQYQALETDVKQTKDGVFVCCHDDTFGGYTIANTNWADLKDVVVNSSRTAGYPSQYGEMPGTGKYSSKICTLERYLEICKEYGIYAVVELKGSPGISNSDQSRMPQLMALIEQEGMLNQTIFLASAYNCLIWVKQNGYEYIPCQYLVDSFASETVFNRCVTYGLDVSGCVTYGNGQTENTAEWVAKYQDAGIKVSTYTFTQYSDYKDVQKWINIGVDFVTVDWHTMSKLNLPDRSESVYYDVVFKDVDGTILKETKVKEGRAAAAPSVVAPKGYVFVGWDKEIKNVSSNLEVIAKYELIEYEITYDSNLYIMTEQSWASKEEFVAELYNDLFTWVTENLGNINGLSYNDGTYKLKINSTEYGTASFASVADILALDVYIFERTFATLMYKPINGTNSETYVPEVDNNYFLNSEPYRSKYINMNAYLLKALKTAYSGYNAEYNQASNNRVQIFFRFHQWAKGTNISAFNKYPTKYSIRYMTGVEATMPTTPVKYTIEDDVTLNNPIASIEFLGWYLDRDCSGEPVTKIAKGSTGNIILYAKWEEIEIEETYSNIIYNLNGGTNNPNNPLKYLEGVTTSLLDPTKEGYEFSGWSTDQEGKNEIIMISERTSGEVTLYANWTAVVYKIDYELGEGNWGNDPVYNGSALTSINTTANSDFWNEYASNIYLYTNELFNSGLNAQWAYRVGFKYDEVSKLYKVVSISLSGAVSFDYANIDYVLVISGSYNNYNSTSSFRDKVEIGQYAVITGSPETGVAKVEIYGKDYVSGTEIANYVLEYTVESKNVLLPTPKCEGKVFKGWSLNSDLTGDVYTVLPEEITGDIILYAVYE